MDEKGLTVSWTTVQLRVTTPLFNGGADGDAGFRISSLRGAMRFWLRAFAGLGIGNDIAGLARLEKDVFGATDRASPAKLRLVAQPPVSTPGQPAWCRGGDGRWIVYLLSQGLGDLRNQRVIKPYIDAGQVIEIQLRLGDDEDIAALVVASLWLTCAYGGLGARTRRGFGGLRIVGADGPLPAPWTPDTVRSPDLAHYQGMRVLWPREPVDACVGPLRRVASRKHVHVDFAVATAQPSYPAFSRQHTAAGVSGGKHFNDWHSLLAHTGKQLRHFRASQPYPAAPYPPPRVKTPEWEQVVRGPMNQFSLGALGLPVGYKDRYVVNAYTGGRELRRASPLWLRPIGGDREWRLFSFAFHGQFVPSDVDVAVHRGGTYVKSVTVGTDDVVDVTRAWIEASANDKDLSQIPEYRTQAVDRARKGPTPP